MSILLILLLLISVICWGVSVFLGIKYLTDWLHSMALNVTDLDIELKIMPVGPTERKKVKDKIDELCEKTPKQHKWMRRLFIYGVILFIMWHIVMRGNIYHSLPEILQF